MTPPVYVVDTHPLVWYFENSPKLSSLAKQALDEIDSGKSLGVVPTIVLAEIMHLSQKGKVPTSIEQIIWQLSRAQNFAVIPLDLMVILLMIPLRSQELHDRVIVATAKSFGASLITRDENIRSSRNIQCVW